MAKYTPLPERLDRISPHMEMTFGEIDRLVRGLPPSARTYRAWWRNGATYPQARAWLEAGRRVASVNLRGKRVRFS